MELIKKLKFRKMVKNENFVHFCRNTSNLIMLYATKALSELTSIFNNFRYEKTLRKTKQSFIIIL